MDPARNEGSRTLNDPRIAAIPDTHGHAKGEHRPYSEERPIAYSARMLFLWFYHACRRGAPRFLMVTDHINYLTFEDPGAVNTLRRALKLAKAGDLYGAAETAGVDIAHAAVVSEGLRRGMLYAIGAEVDNDPRSRPDAQNIVDAMRPDGMIRSVHFVPITHPEKGPDWPWPYDNPEFTHFFDLVGVDQLWELYMARLIEDVEKLPGNIVGHFYKPATFGHWPSKEKLEQYEDRIIDACAARGMAIELNTRFLYRESSEDAKRRYLEANRRLLRKAKAKGVGIAVGSAAHSPKDQGGAFDAILQLLDECDINELVFPVAGRLARVALRATKEHIEAQSRTQGETISGSSITGFSRAELGLPEEPEVSKSSKAKTRRDVGPKKRTTGPERATERPAKGAASSKASAAAKSETAEPKTKPAKLPKPVKPAKAAKAPAEKKPAKPAKAAAKPAAKAVKAPAKPAAKAVAKPAKAAKAAKPAKPAVSAAKKIPVKAAATKAKPAAKKKTVTKKTVTKRPTAAAKKAPTKKPVAKTATRAKPTAKKPPAKAASSKKATKKRR